MWTLIALRAFHVERVFFPEKLFKAKFINLIIFKGALRAPFFESLYILDIISFFGYNVFILLSVINQISI